MMPPIGVMLDVYWNLHKRCWSVRLRGKVIAHVEALRMKHVHWIVQPAGNARVRREKRKNVHAFARGFVASVWENLDQWPTPTTGHRVKYDPYKHTSFMGHQHPDSSQPPQWRPIKTSTHVTLESSHENETRHGPRKPLVWAGD